MSGGVPLQDHIPDFLESLDSNGYERVILMNVVLKAEACELTESDACQILLDDDAKNEVSVINTDLRKGLAQALPKDLESFEISFSQYEELKNLQKAILFDASAKFSDVVLMKRKSDGKLIKYGIISHIVSISDRVSMITMDKTPFQPSEDLSVFEKDDAGKWIVYLQAFKQDILPQCGGKKNADIVATFCDSNNFMTKLRQWVSQFALEDLNELINDPNDVPQYFASALVNVLNREKHKLDALCAGSRNIDGQCRPVEPADRSGVKVILGSILTWQQYQDNLQNFKSQLQAVISVILAAKGLFDATDIEHLTHLLTTRFYVTQSEYETSFTKFKRLRSVAPPTSVELLKSVTNGYLKRATALFKSNMPPVERGALMWVLFFVTLPANTFILLDLIGKHQNARKKIEDEFHVSLMTNVDGSFESASQGFATYQTEFASHVKRYLQSLYA